jgi:hypothetical protein
LNGKPLYSVPTELVFAAHGEISRAALVGLKISSGDTTVIESEPAIVVEPYPEHFPTSPEHEKRLRNELAALGAAAGLPEMQIFFHPKFPVDARHNAKVFNDQLGEWASALLAAQPRSGEKPSSGQKQGTSR